MCVCTNVFFDTVPKKNLYPMSTAAKNTTAIQWLMHAAAGTVTGTDAATSHLWTKRAKGRYFTLHRFTAAESAKISTGLRSPDTFTFTKEGHLQCGQVFEWFNPWIAANRDFAGAATLEFYASQNPLFVWNETHVISNEFTFILCKTESGGVNTWALVYYWLHRTAFRDEYVRQQSPAPWAVTGVIPNLLRTVAADWVITLENGKKAYLDPAMNLLASKKQCASAGLFNDPALHEEHIKSSLKKKVFTKLNEQFTMGELPRCVCIGKSLDLLRTQVRTQSFIHVAWPVLSQGERCPNIEITNFDCNIDLATENGNQTLNNTVVKCENDSGDGAADQKSDHDSDTDSDPGSDHDSDSVSDLGPNDPEEDDEGILEQLQTQLAEAFGQDEENGAFLLVLVGAILAFVVVFALVRR